MSPSEKKARAAAPPDPGWDVKYKRGVGKILAILPERVGAALDDLVEDLKETGPVQLSWSNYSQLRGQKGQPKGVRRYHCHLKKGKPTWVACWQVEGKSIVIEIYYVGPHGAAPY